MSWTSEPEPSCACHPEQKPEPTCEKCDILKRWYDMRDGTLRHRIDELTNERDDLRRQLESALFQRDWLAKQTGRKV